MPRKPFKIGDVWEANQTCTADTYYCNILSIIKISRPSPYNPHDLVWTIIHVKCYNELGGMEITDWRINSQELLERWHRIYRTYDAP